MKSLLSITLLCVLTVFTSRAEVAVIPLPLTIKTGDRTFDTGKTLSLPVVPVGIPLTAESMQGWQQQKDPNVALLLHLLETIRTRDVKALTPLLIQTTTERITDPKVFLDAMNKMYLPEGKASVFLGYSESPGETGCWIARADTVAKPALFLFQQTPEGLKWRISSSDSPLNVAQGLVASSTITTDSLAKNLSASAPETFDLSAQLSADQPSTTALSEKLAQAKGAPVRELSSPIDSVSFVNSLLPKVTENKARLLLYGNLLITAYVVNTTPMVKYFEFADGTLTELPNNRQGFFTSYLMNSLARNDAKP
jgi:hypothetical protein